MHPVSKSTVQTLSCCSVDNHVGCARETQRFAYVSNAPLILIEGEFQRIDDGINQHHEIALKAANHFMCG